MRKIILSMALLLFLVKTFSQNVDSTLSKNYYLQKSKDQRIAGAVMMVGGSALMSIGLIMGLHEFGDALANTFSGTPHKNAGATSQVLFFAGLGMSFCSFPLLLASRRNRRIAATISLHMQKTSIRQQHHSLVLKTQPALTLRVPL